MTEIRRCACGKTGPAKTYFVGARCRPCYARARYRKDPEKTLSNRRKHYQADPQRFREQRKKYKPREAKNNRDWRLRQYGVTQEEYDLLFKKQKGCCKICGTKKPGHRKNFCVDHDHETGKVRGLLCSRCNFGIGLFDDDVGVLKKAIRYLES
jgi:hypothetical protein